MEILSMLWSLVLALAAGVAITIFITAVKCNRIQLRPMKVEPVDLLAVPAALRAALDPGRQWLMSRGFRYLSSFRIEHMVPGEERHGDVYVDDARAVFALVTPREAPRPGDTTAIEFQSIFADGTAMMTINRYRHALVHEVSGWPVEDHYLADMAQVLERHLARVAKSAQPAVADPALRDRLFAERTAGYIDRIVAAGVARRARDGSVHIRFDHALRYVARLLFGNLRAARVKPLPLGEPLAHPSLAKGAGVAADLQAYRSRRAIEGAMSSRGKWKVSVMTAAAFVALGAWLWDWTYAVFVLVVIALHEGGHFLAMKVVGYRNLHVFFVPGLGGLATGDKHDATAAQKVFVYLAGPVPGIAIATAALLLMPDAVVKEASTFLTIMLVINVINLLPVTPLDGGRVLEVLLFARWPLMRLAFAGGSCLLLLLAGAATSDRVMVVIGVLVAMSLPAQWRFFRVARRVGRPSAGGLDEGAAARRVFGEMNRPEFSKWGVQQRIAVADPLIAELRSPAPRLLGTLGGLGVYFACFAVPAGVALAVSPTVRDFYDAVAEAREANAEGLAFAAEAGDEPSRNWLAELDTTKGSPPDRRLPLLADAAEHHMLFEPKDQEELRKLAKARPAGDLLRVRALLAVSDDEEDPAPVLRMLRAEVGDADEESRRLRARIDARLAMELPPGEEKLAALAASVVQLEGDPPATALRRSARERLAHEREALRDFEGAERDLRQALAEAGVDERAPGVVQARTEYLKFLMRRERWADAEALVRPPLDALLAAGKPGRLRLLSHFASIEALFWMAVHQGHPADAQHWLAVWEQAMTRRAAERNPTFTLAKIASAELAGDGAGAARESKRLASLQGLKFLCMPERRMPLLADTALAAKPRDVLARSGACANATTAM